MSDIRHATMTIYNDDGSESQETMTLYCNPTREELAALLDSATSGEPVTTLDGRIRCFPCYFAGRETCIHLVKIPGSFADNPIDNEPPSW
jgi:hypothetical protein